MNNLAQYKQYLNEETSLNKIQEFITFKEIDAKSIVMNCIYEMSKNTKIAECSKASIMSCLAQCARYGLVPNSDLGHVYFVPYKDKCTLLVGYKGMLTLAYRSGNVKSISSELIYENDVYDFDLGTSPFLMHRKTLVNRGKVIAAYAIAHLKNGSTAYRIMTIEDINIARSSSTADMYSKKGGKPSIWDTHFDEMAKKTCIRSLFKYLDISSEMSIAIADDEKPHDQKSGHVYDASDEFFDESGKEYQPKNKIDNLQDKLAKMSSNQVAMSA